MALTKKQKTFIDEYLIDLNATQAAIRAGYSPDSARQSGSDNMNNPYIRAHIDKAMAERSKRTGVNADRVIQELAKMAFINAVDVINTEDATLKDGALPEDTAAIQSVKVKSIPTKDGEGVEREIKMADKIKALELLGKHLGMFTDKVNLDVQTSDKLDDILSQMGGVGLEE